MSDAIALIFVGGIFAVIGLVAIARKRFTLPFGQNGFRRIFYPKPMIVFKLTEARAVLFGSVSLISGLAMVAVAFNVYSTRNTTAIKDGILTITVIIGAGFTFLVFVIEVLIEYLVALKNKAQK